MENNITENEKKIYLLEVWKLCTNEWWEITKSHRVTHLVTLDKETEDYKRQAVTRIVKKMSGDNVENPDYDISSRNDEGVLSLIADWGNILTGDKWCGVEAVITPMNKITEI